MDHSAYSNKPDHMIPLTARGRSQALVVGAKLRRIAEDGRVLFLVSPYRRTQETLFGMLESRVSLESSPFHVLFSADLQGFYAGATGQFHPISLKNLVPSMHHCAPSCLRSLSS